MAPCYHPIPARRSDVGPWRLNPPLGEADTQLRCGKCLGCRTALQNEWTERCIHEARNSKQNTFITLTYADDRLPYELIPFHLTTFLKRLRDASEKNPKILTTPEGGGIRYLACGEYGDKTARPHYHANLFNCAFTDQRKYKKDLYTSETLNELWGYGAAKLAAFTPATAGYVAGYITQHGHREYYNTDGEVLEPPFKRQSTKPAIGLRWLMKNHQDIQHGYIIHEGQKKPIPRYYKKILDKIAHNKYIGPKQLHEIQQYKTNLNLGNKLAEPKEETDKYTTPRLQDAEKIHQQHFERRHRDYE